MTATTTWHNDLTERWTMLAREAERLNDAACNEQAWNNLTLAERLFDQRDAVVRERDRVSLILYRRYEHLTDY